jgi:isoleucyl-tRNA synthetase
MTRKTEPIYKSIGPKFGKLVNQAAEQIRALSETDIAQIEQDGYFNLRIADTEAKINKDDVEIRTENREGFIVESADDLTVAINIVLSASLINEGLARDFVNRVQNMRKDADFKVTDRIFIHYEGSEMLQNAITSQATYIKNETLANDLINKIEFADYQKEWTINDEKIVVGITRV